MKTGRFSKRFATWVIAGIFPVLQGCTTEAPPDAGPPVTRGPRTVELRFMASSSYTWLERESIDAATNMWFFQTGGMVRIRVGYEGGLNDGVGVIMPTSADDPDIIREDAKHEPGWETAAVTWSRPPRTKILTVKGRVHPGPQMTEIMMHEFGHAIGLDHHNWPGSIMYPSYLAWRDVCLTPYDTDQLCGKYDCSGWEMLPCRPSYDDSLKVDGGG